MSKDSTYFINVSRAVLHHTIIWRSRPGCWKSRARWGKTTFNIMNNQRDCELSIAQPIVDCLCFVCICTLRSWRMHHLVELNSLSIWCVPLWTRIFRITWSFEEISSKMLYVLSLLIFFAIISRNELRFQIGVDIRYSRWIRNNTSSNLSVSVWVVYVCHYLHSYEVRSWLGMGAIKL